MCKSGWLAEERGVPIREGVLTNYPQSFPHGRTKLFSERFPKGFANSILIDLVDYRPLFLPPPKGRENRLKKVALAASRR